MKFTKILTLLVVFSAIAFNGSKNDVLASSNPETLSTSQKSDYSGILAFFNNLFFGSAKKTAPEQQTYTSPASGKQIQVAPGVNSPLIISLNLNGSLPGAFVGTIEYNSSNGISGGTWQQSVTRTNSDGTTTEIAGLSGTFTSGSVTVNADGTVASVNAARMSVTSGSGDYSNVSSGSGTLQGNLDNSNAPASFSGTEVLNF